MYLKLAAALVVLSSGCISGDPGQLENGIFSVASDCGHFACVDPLPERVAQGARLRVKYQGSVDSEDPEKQTSGAQEPSYRISGVGLHRVTCSSEDHCLFPAAGYNAVASVSASGTVHDFTHILVVPPKNIQLESSAFTLSVGQQQYVFPRARDAHGYLLRGELPVAWSTTDPEVLTIIKSLDGSVLLRASEAGNATVRAVSGEMVAELEFRVEGAS